jgi:hypothetical protein
MVVLLMALAGCSAPVTPTGASDGAGDAAGGRFTCGTTTCSRATEFCYSVSIGGTDVATGSDGGGPSCSQLPATCMTDRTCACVQRSVTFCITGCIDTDGVVADCSAP